MEIFPLHVAARNGDIDRVKHFVELGFFVDNRDDHNFTPLHYAAVNGHLEVAEFLINKNCDLNIAAPNGKTALLFAAQKAKYDIVELLMKSGTDLSHFDKNKWNILHFICHKGCLKVTQYLVNEKCDLNARTSKGNTPLLMAAQKNCRDIFDLLVEAGADMKCRNYKNETILHYASRRNGWLDVVQYFTNEKWQLDLKTSYEKSPLMLAIEYGQHDVLQLLIKSGANPNIPGSENPTALHYACSKGLLEIVQYFINEKFDLDIRTADGDAPLLIASENGHKDVTNLLIESGANLNFTTDYYGHTVLHIATDHRWLDVVSNIIKVGSPFDVDAIDKFFYRTPLHDACSDGAVGIAELLLKAGADIYATDTFDQSPFLLAISQQEPKFKIIDLLIKYGLYFNYSDFGEVYKNPVLKEYIFTDVGLCTQLIFNQFNKICLPRVYLFPGAVENLPRIETVEINCKRSTAYQETAKCVENEIQTKTFCDVRKVQPIVLKILCANSLFNYCETWNIDFPIPVFTITSEELEEFGQDFLNV